MFKNLFFWIKAIKVSSIIFITYWLFGFETGLLVGIVLVCLFLSKISLTIQDIYADLKEQFKGKPSKRIIHKTHPKLKIQTGQPLATK